MTCECPACGYDLSGHARWRRTTCPECGGVCTPAELDRGRRDRTLRWQIAAIAGALLLLALCFVTRTHPPFAPRIRPEPDGQWGLAVFYVPVILAPILPVVAAWLGARLTCERGSVLRSWLVAGPVVALVLTLGFWALRYWII